jgi:hypothetical protein
MHPSVTAAGPAACPICGMALVAMVARPRAALAPRPSAPGDVARAEAGDVETVRVRQSSVEVDAPARVTGDGAVEAVLYRDELLTLQPGELARFTPVKGTPLGATLTAEAPVPHDQATLRVRFRLDTTDTLTEGQTGRLWLAARPRKTIVVPESAVLLSPAGPIVLVEPPGGGTTVPRAVQIGTTSFGLVAVTAGLTEGERIAVRHAFFLEADRRLYPDPVAP